MFEVLNLHSHQRSKLYTAYFNTKGVAKHNGLIKLSIMVLIRRKRKLFQELARVISKVLHIQYNVTLGENSFLWIKHSHKVSFLGAPVFSVYGHLTRLCRGEENYRPLFCFCSSTLFKGLLLARRRQFFFT